MKCNLCPNLCNLDRDKFLGKCHSDNNMRICRIALHNYEEPIISGKNGSGTIFFSGCSMDCEFCQNYQISKAMVGKIYTPLSLSEEIKKLEKSGAHNINFVTPTHFSHKIKETLDIYRPNIPICYNTSGYELPNIIKEMEKYVDIYLVDLKYGDDKTCMKYSNRENYVENAVESIKIMCQQKPIKIVDGIMRQGVIVRHLMLPQNLDNSKKVVDIFAENFKNDALFSIMSQFIPCYKSTITQKLKPIEYKIIIKYMEEKGVEEGFMQQMSSASTDYIPQFDI